MANPFTWNACTDLPGDLQEFGAAMRLLIFELLAVGANCNGEESPVIFRSILARARGAQLDWNACQSTLHRLLQLSPCTDKSPLSTENGSHQLFLTTPIYDRSSRISVLEKVFRLNCGTTPKSRYQHIGTSRP